jgi:hypothetical protein
VQSSHVFTRIDLVPETDEEREQVAQQAAEIQADPEGKKLIEQLTDWVTEIMNRLDDVAAKHRVPVRAAGRRGQPDGAVLRGRCPLDDGLPAVRQVSEPAAGASP